MIRERWDETQHRLQDWTNGQAQSEGLAARILQFDGYENIDPIHPHGGKDGGADILCTREGISCLAAVFFPRGEHRFTEIKNKFKGDFQKAMNQQPPIGRFLFITNQELSRSQRRVLLETAAGMAGNIDVDLYHIERIAVILDSYQMRDVRSQYLGIEGNSNNGSGGRGGNAYASGARSTAIGGKGGRGGVGSGGDAGDAVASGEQSMSIGGNGGDGAQSGGVGGRGAPGPCERPGFPSSMWGPGRGGRGASTPEAIRVSEVLVSIGKEYSARFPQDELFIDAGLEQVPTAWLNVRLVERGEKWQVDGEEAFRALRPLDH